MQELIGITLIAAIVVWPVIKLCWTLFRPETQEERYRREREELRRMLP